jgi:hypothetical protein
VRCKGFEPFFFGFVSTKISATVPAL